MGHADLSNLSKFFVRRLYAKGKLSILECAQALVRAGETLHASEGQYHDEDMLRMGLLDIVHYLTREDPTQHGYSGPDGGGPWIEPFLSVWIGKKSALTPQARALLAACDQNPEDSACHAVASDKLEEDGLTEWAAFVRALPRQRQVLAQWLADDDDSWRDGEWDVFDAIKWQFAPGWRQRYREVPLLSNVTH